MKGQYLAIETVLTLGMGIALATGSIIIFSDYQSEIASTTEEKQVETVFTLLQNSLFTLEKSDSGHTALDLPENIGGTSYQISMGENITVSVGGNIYKKKIGNLEGYTLDGGARGGTVNLYKRGDNFSLRG